MKTRNAVLIILVSALLTAAAAALLMNIAEHKREGKLIAACPCPSESCPHRGHSVE